MLAMHVLSLRKEHWLAKAGHGCFNKIAFGKCMYLWVAEYIRPFLTSGPLHMFFLWPVMSLCSTPWVQIFTQTSDFQRGSPKHPLNLSAALISLITSLFGSSALITFNPVYHCFSNPSHLPGGWWRKKGLELSHWCELAWQMYLVLVTLVVAMTEYLTDASQGRKCLF